MNSKIIYAILLLLSVVIELSYSQASCSSALDCKYGKCEDGKCMCNLKCRHFGDGGHKSKWVCMGKKENPMPRCVAVMAACNEARVASDDAQVAAIIQPKVNLKKVGGKNCKNLQYTKSMDEFCVDQSYCGYKGICIMKKNANGSDKYRECLCDKRHIGERCLKMASHGGEHPTNSKKPSIGLIVIITAFGLICLGTILLIVQRCRRTAGHTSLDEVGTEDGSIAGEKENNRSSHVLGESAPLWK